MLRFFSIFLVIEVLDITSSSLQLNPYLYNYITVGFRLSGCVALVFGFLKAVEILHEYLTKIVARTDNQMDDQLLPVVVRVLNILVIGTGVVYALTIFDIDLTAILAGLSVGALALALAAQDTVKNFLGSVTVFIDKPFKIGDYVKVNGVEATVESVGIRSTRLRTPDRSLVTIPNGELSNMTIDNLENETCGVGKQFLVSPMIQSLKRFKTYVSPSRNFTLALSTLISKIALCTCIP